MTDTHQPPSLPTLQPGDSHMESLIEAAIQGHASTRDAMRWLVRQLVPATQPAEVTDEQIAACVKRASTYGLPFVGLLNPGGTPSDFSKRFTAEILALRPEQVPMTDELFDLICNAIDKADTITMEGDYMLDSDDCIAVVRVMQALLSVRTAMLATKDAT